MMSCKNLLLVTMAILGCFVGGNSQAEWDNSSLGKIVSDARGKGMTAYEEALNSRAAVPGNEHDQAPAVKSVETWVKGLYGLYESSLGEWDSLPKNATEAEREKVADRVVKVSDALATASTIKVFFEASIQDCENAGSSVSPRQILEGKKELLTLVRKTLLRRGEVSGLLDSLIADVEKREEARKGLNEAKTYQDKIMLSVNIVDDFLDRNTQIVDNHALHRWGVASTRSLVSNRRIGPWGKPSSHSQEVSDDVQLATGAVRNDNAEKK